jgi:hypothetical protein
VASVAAEASNGTSSNIFFQMPSRSPSHGSGGNKLTRGNKGHLCSLTVDVYIFPFKIIDFCYHLHPSKSRNDGF